MTLLKWAAIALAGYGCLVALMYVAQRSLMYFPERVRTAPADAGLPEAREATLDTADGERIVAWHIPPRGEQPVIIYLHGNGASLRWRVHRFRALTASGNGLVAVSYRGYAGSTGSPTETGLIADATAAYEWTSARYSAERIVLWGESLGTGVAVALASERPVARIVLESPFTSAAEIGAAAYPFVPVRLLMRDPFRSDRRIGKIAAPILVLHGERDTVVPIAHGERLYEMIRSPKQFVRLPLADHNDHDEHGAMALVAAFVAGEGR